jgi:hypothetical protein
MQKVVGSSPIIRSIESPAPAGFSVAVRPLLAVPSRDDEACLPARGNPQPQTYSTEAVAVEVPVLLRAETVSV